MVKVIFSREDIEEAVAIIRKYINGDRGWEDCYSDEAAEVTMCAFRFSNTPTEDWFELEKNWAINTARQIYHMQEQW